FFLRLLVQFFLTRLGFFHLNFSAMDLVSAHLFWQGAGVVIPLLGKRDQSGKQDQQNQQGLVLKQGHTFSFSMVRDGSSFQPMENRLSLQRSELFVATNIPKRISLQRSETGNEYKRCIRLEISRPAGAK